MSLPPHILQRVERLYSYHQRSKLLPMGSRPGAPPDDPDYKPAEFRVFADAPKIALPTTLLDAPTPMLTLLTAGQDALPDSLRAPPQDLKTLATWLYYAAGETRRTTGRTTVWSRPFADANAMVPLELYVAAFAIKDLEPGLYHFCPREFALRRLREGAGPLLQIKKGRPDLEFLKTLPAAILVSGCYWRAVYRHGRRGYRTMLVDAGQMVQNLVIAGAGLGAQTVTRLRMNDSTLRELIGIGSAEPLGSAETVLAMVAWADRAVAPLAIPPGTLAARMPPIPRPPLSARVTDDSGSLEPFNVHLDCVAPGVAVRELRPPLTELSPLPATVPSSRFDAAANDAPPASLPARQALLGRRPMSALARRPMTRGELLALNHAAFRGGSFFPMFPDGPHVACVRPFWIMHEVTGFDRGIWYYHPQTDRWSMLNAGQFRRESKYIAGDSDCFSHAAAVCVMTANLHALMTQGGPDAYRLAHLEAGIAAQRLYLAATSLGLGAATSHSFYDEECRTFLGLSRTGWEVLSVTCVGKPATADEVAADQKARALGQVGMHGG
jgi:SagB-type dehydrogenase family enzyme